MNDNPPTTTDQDQARALRDLEAEMSPGWHCWPGVIPPLLYARRPKSSPPIVVRGGDMDQLRSEMRRAERERGIRR